MFDILWLDYLYICMAEEALFRMIPMELIGNKRPLLAFAFGVIPYALLHLIWFGWLIVLMCFFIGLVNCVSYYNVKRPYGYILAVVFHFTIGGIGYLTGIIGG